jgi:hypothetical protein
MRHRPGFSGSELKSQLAGEPVRICETILLFGLPLRPHEEQ